MKDSIKNVYSGLPSHLRDSVFWIGRIFRTNSLSHSQGGSDVVVEYRNGKVVGYDWIKFPSRYIFKIFVRGLSTSPDKFLRFDEQKQLEIVKKKISRVFTRKIDYQKNKDSSFEEIWNHALSNKLPWTVLEEFDLIEAESHLQDEKNQIENKLSWSFLIENKKAVLSIFATHFSFTSEQLFAFKDLLPYGQVWEYSNGYELWCEPGIIFNDNINWSKSIQNLFQRPPIEIEMRDGGSYLSNPLNFEEIPYSRQNVVKEDFDIFVAKYYPEDEDAAIFYDIMYEEFLSRERASHKYSMEEIKNYVSNTLNHAEIKERFNRNLFLQFYEVIKLSIPDFSVNNMLEMFKKCS